MTGSGMGIVFSAGMVQAFSAPRIPDTHCARGMVRALLQTKRK